MITQVFILSDVHTAVADLTQGTESKRREGGNLHHQQSEGPDGEDEMTEKLEQTRENKRRKRQLHSDFP